MIFLSSQKIQFKCVNEAIKSVLFPELKLTANQVFAV